MGELEESKVNGKIIDFEIFYMEEEIFYIEFHFILIAFSCLLEIEIDLARTKPRLLEKHPFLKTQMLNVLSAFAAYRPDIGFIQGMTYPCFILALNFDEYHSFKYFCNLIITNK